MRTSQMLTRIKSEGSASATTPAAGWQASDVANDFGKTYSAFEHKATRSIPTLAPILSPTTASSEPSSTILAPL